MYGATMRVSRTDIPQRFPIAKRPSSQVEQPPQAALSTTLTLLEAGLKQEKNGNFQRH